MFLFMVRFFDARYFVVLLICVRVLCSIVAVHFHVAFLLVSSLLRLFSSLLLSSPVGACLGLPCLATSWYVLGERLYDCGRPPLMSLCLQLFRLVATSVVCVYKFHAKARKTGQPSDPQTAALSVCVCVCVLQVFFPEG